MKIKGTTLEELKALGLAGSRPESDQTVIQGDSPAPFFSSGTLQSNEDTPAFFRTGTINAGSGGNTGGGAGGQVITAGRGATTWSGRLAVAGGTNSGTGNISTTAPVGPGQPSSVVPGETSHGIGRFNGDRRLLAAMTQADRDKLFEKFKEAMSGQDGLWGGLRGNLQGFKRDWRQPGSGQIGHKMPPELLAKFAEMAKGARTHGNWGKIDKYTAMTGQSAASTAAATAATAPQEQLTPEEAKAQAEKLAKLPTKDVNGTKYFDIEAIVADPGLTTIFKDIVPGGAAIIEQQQAAQVQADQLARLPTKEVDGVKYFDMDAIAGNAAFSALFAAAVTNGQSVLDAYRLPTITQDGNKYLDMAKIAGNPALSAALVNGVPDGQSILDNYNARKSAADKVSGYSNPIVAIKGGESADDIKAAYGLDDQQYGDYKSAIDYVLSDSQIDVDKLVKDINDPSKVDKQAQNLRIANNVFGLDMQPNGSGGAWKPTISPGEQPVVPDLVPRALPTGITDDDIAALRAQLDDLVKQRATLPDTATPYDGTDNYAKLTTINNQIQAIQSNLDYIAQYQSGVGDTSLGDFKDLPDAAALANLKLSTDPSLYKYVSTDTNNQNVTNFNIQQAVKDGVSDASLKAVGFTKTTLDQVRSLNKIQDLLGGKSVTSYDDIAKAFEAGMEGDLFNLGITADDINIAVQQKYLIDNGYWDKATGEIKVGLALARGVPPALFTHGLGITDEAIKANQSLINGGYLDPETGDVHYLQAVIDKHGDWLVATGYNEDDINKLLNQLDEIKTDTPELYDILVKDGPAAYDKAVDEYNNNLAKFASSVSGYDDYQAALKELGIDRSNNVTIEDLMSAYQAGHGSAIATVFGKDILEKVKVASNEKANRFESDLPLETETPSSVDGLPAAVAANFTGDASAALKRLSMDPGKLGTQDYISLAKAIGGGATDEQLIAAGFDQVSIDATRALQKSGVMDKDGNTDFFGALNAGITQTMLTAAGYAQKDIDVIFKELNQKIESSQKAIAQLGITDPNNTSLNDLINAYRAGNAAAIETVYGKNTLDDVIAAAAAMDNLAAFNVPGQDGPDLIKAYKAGRIEDIRAAYGDETLASIEKQVKAQDRINAALGPAIGPPNLAATPDLIKAYKAGRIEDIRAAYGDETLASIEKQVKAQDRINAVLKPAIGPPNLAATPDIVAFLRNQKYSDDAAQTLSTAGYLPADIQLSISFGKAMDLLDTKYGGDPMKALWSGNKEDAAAAKLLYPTIDTKGISMPNTSVQQLDALINAGKFYTGPGESGQDLIRDAMKQSGIQLSYWDNRSVKQQWDSLSADQKKAVADIYLTSQQTFLKQGHEIASTPQDVSVAVNKFIDQHFSATDQAKVGEYIKEAIKSTGLPGQAFLFTLDKTSGPVGVAKDYVIKTQADLSAWADKHSGLAGVGAGALSGLWDMTSSIATVIPLQLITDAKQITDGKISTTAADLAGMGVGFITWSAGLPGKIASNPATGIGYSAGIGLSLILGPKVLKDMGVSAYRKVFTKGYEPGALRVDIEFPGGMLPEKMAPGRGLALANVLEDVTTKLGNSKTGILPRDVILKDPTNGSVIRITPLERSAKILASPKDNWAFSADPNYKWIMEGIKKDGFSVVGVPREFEGWGKGLYGSDSAWTSRIESAVSKTGEYKPGLIAFKYSNLEKLPVDVQDLYNRGMVQEGRSLFEKKEAEGLAAPVQKLIDAGKMDEARNLYNATGQKGLLPGAYETWKVIKSGERQTKVEREIYLTAGTKLMPIKPDAANNTRFGENLTASNYTWAERDFYKTEQKPVPEQLRLLLDANKLAAAEKLYKQLLKDGKLEGLDSTWKLTKMESGDYVLEQKKLIAAKGSKVPILWFAVEGATRMAPSLMVRNLTEFAGLPYNTLKRLTRIPKSNFEFSTSGESSLPELPGIEISHKRNAYDFQASSRHATDKTLEVQKMNASASDTGLTVIGDLHGSSKDLLQDINSGYKRPVVTGLSSVPGTWRWNGKAQQVVQIGDIVDRGPDYFKIRKGMNKLADESGRTGGGITRLIGNHELAYLNGTKIKGIDYVDRGAIKQSIVDDILSGKLKAAVAVNGQLFTHAGVSLDKFPQWRGKSADYISQEINTRFARALATNKWNDPIFDIGRADGGKGIGGPFWMRTKETSPAALDLGYKQFAGHTPRPSGVQLEANNFINTDTGRQWAAHWNGQLRAYQDTPAMRTIERGTSLVKDMGLKEPASAGNANVSQFTIPIPALQRAGIGQVIHDLQPLAGKDVTWYKPAELKAQLEPPERLTPEQVYTARRIVSRVLAKHGLGDLSFKGVLGLNDSGVPSYVEHNLTGEGYVKLLNDNPKVPKYIAMAMKGKMDSLYTAQREIDAAMQRLNIPSGFEDFMPAVILGEFKAGTPAEARMQAMENIMRHQPAHAVAFKAGSPVLEGTTMAPKPKTAVLPTTRLDEMAAYEEELDTEDKGVTKIGLDFSPKYVEKAKETSTPAEERLAQTPVDIPVEASRQYKAATEARKLPGEESKIPGETYNLPGNYAEEKATQAEYAVTPKEGSVPPEELNAEAGYSGGYKVDRSYYGASKYSPTNYKPPAYNPPGYNPPGYRPPGYNPPGYRPPGYNPPGYKPPSYNPHPPPPPHSGYSFQAIIPRLKVPKGMIGQNNSNESNYWQGFDGAYTWKQGFGWWAGKFPYDKADDYKFGPYPPPGARHMADMKTAFETIQQITGEPPDRKVLDMGIMDVFVNSPQYQEGVKGAIQFRRDPNQVTKGEIDLKDAREGGREPSTPSTGAVSQPAEPAAEIISQPSQSSKGTTAKDQQRLRRGPTHTSDISLRRNPHDTLIAHQMAAKPQTVTAASIPSVKMKNRVLDNGSKPLTRQTTPLVRITGSTDKSSLPNGVGLQKAPTPANSGVNVSVVKVRSPRRPRNIPPLARIGNMSSLMPSSNLSVGRDGAIYVAQDKKTGTTMLSRRPFKRRKAL